MLNARHPAARFAASLRDCRSGLAFIEFAFALPVAWGLLGVFVAEQERGNAPLAYVALAAAVAVLVGAIVLTFRLRRGVERPAA